MPPFLTPHLHTHPVLWSVFLLEVHWIFLMKNEVLIIFFLFHKETYFYIPGVLNNETKSSQFSFLDCYTD